MLYNFIVCEDNKIFNSCYQEIIITVAKKLNINFMIHSFTRYNEEFKNLIYNSNIENKIYILDLLMPGVHGDKIANIIRETDLASFIIFITSYHDEYEDVIINGEYFYLKYIDKEKNFKEVLFDTLKRNIEKKKHIETLKFEIKNKFYQIIPNEITYICTENRKVAIHNTQKDSISIPTTLNKMQEILSDKFILSKNCCLVNISRISNIDKNNRVIFFDNKDKTNLVSRLYLKKIINKLNLK